MTAKVICIEITLPLDLDKFVVWLPPAKVTRRPSPPAESKGALRWMSSLGPSHRDLDAQLPPRRVFQLGSKVATTHCLKV